MDDVQSGAARGGHRPPDDEVLRRAAAKLGEEAEALLARARGPLDSSLDGGDPDPDGLAELHLTLRSAYVRTYPFTQGGDLLSLEDNDGITAEDAHWIRHHLAIALDELAEIRHLLSRDRARGRV